MNGYDAPIAPSGGPRRPVLAATGPAQRRSWGALWAQYRSYILAGTLSVVITVAIVLLSDRIAALSRLGYLGVFLISLLGNATVIFPVPSLAVVFAGGSVLNPWIVGLCSGVGEPLGELTGYLAGYGGSAVVADSARYERVRGYMKRHGMLTIFVLSTIPNPLFDLAGIVAGMTHVPIWRFLLPCWLGKTIKGVLIAHLGSVAIQWVTSLLQGWGW